MGDRPIIFSAPMVLALLAGTKTQTRRLAWREKQCPGGAINDGGGQMDYVEPSVVRIPSPWRKVKPGDRLYVRESAYILGHWRQDGVTKSGRPKLRFITSSRRMALYVSDALEPGQAIISATGDMRVAAGQGFWLRPSIHMPRWASRLTLTVTDVRVQRLQEISEEDAEAEGRPICHQCGGCGWQNTGPDGGVQCNAWMCGEPDREWFGATWNHIHGPGAWDANPDVVVISFRCEHRNIDQVGP